MACTIRPQGGARRQSMVWVGRTLSMPVPRYCAVGLRADRGSAYLCDRARESAAATLGSAASTRLRWVGSRW